MFNVQCSMLFIQSIYILRTYISKIILSSTGFSREENIYGHYTNIHEATQLANVLLKHND